MTVPTGTGSQEVLAAATQTPQNNTSPLSEESIVSWLRQNPRFFHQHQELLLELSIPHESGKAISLLERQVTLFRERQSDLQNQIHEFIDNARENDNLFEKTRLVLLELLRCTSLTALLEAIDQRLAQDFDASAAALVFVCEQRDGAHALGRRLSQADIQTTLGDLARQRTYCGALSPSQQRLLFQNREPAIVSAAIVPLHLPEDAPFRRDHGLPLLLIGSSEEQHFNSSLDTLFLDFIGEVLAVHLQNLVATA